MSTSFFNGDLVKTALVSAILSPNNLNEDEDIFLAREQGNPQHDMLDTEAYDGSGDNAILDNPESTEGPEGFEGPESFDSNPGSKDPEVPKGAGAQKKDTLATLPDQSKTLGEVHNKEHRKLSEDGARFVPSFAWEDILRTLTSSDPKKSIARWMVKGLRSGREMHCVILRSFEWSTWAPCSRSCGGGLRSRGRDRPTKRELEKEICNKFSCPNKKAPTMQRHRMQKSFQWLGKMCPSEGKLFERNGKV